MRNILVLALMMFAFSKGFSQTPVAYQNPDYSGSSLALNVSYPNLEGLRCQTSWYQHLESVKVPDGWKVELFEGANYSGASLVLTADAMNLGYQDWKGRAASVRVTHGGVLPGMTCPCIQKAPRPRR